MALITKLLWGHQRRGLLWGAGIGTFLGLFLLLMALQLIFDLNQMMGGGGSQDDRFVVINKKVDLSNTFGTRAAFEEEEVAEISEQAFVRTSSRFLSNQFKVAASSQRLGFYTELFFEAIEDDFLDVLPEDWSWDTPSDPIPIMLSRDYLALYNFGFAPSQGLPQFNPKTIQRVSMDVILRGNGRREVFKGRIVGFSDRYNSILVPKKFMEWANKGFGDGPQAAASRLVLEVENPYSQSFRQFLEDKGYEVSSGRLIGGKALTMIRVVLAFVILLGLIILLLAALVFLLNFQVIISRASRQIRLLLQLGYRRSQLGRVLETQLFRWFGGIVALTLLIFVITRILAGIWFRQQGFEISTWPHILVILIVLVLLAALVYWNQRSIRKAIAGLG